jgi:3-(3-hydroxy-phenyl)propionate hydroxylase
LGTSYKARPKPPSWWDQVRTARHFTRPASDVGDRFPDAEVFGPDGRRRALHELVQTDFVALVVVDPRKHPELEPDPPGLTQYVLHQFDAAVDTGVRERFLYDTGGQVMRRLGTQADMVYLIRPDHHIAAMAPYHDARTPLNLYQAYVGRNAMGDVAAPMRQLG